MSVYKKVGTELERQNAYEWIDLEWVKISDKHTNIIEYSIDYGDNWDVNLDNPTTFTVKDLPITLNAPEISRADKFVFRGWYDERGDDPDYGSMFDEPLDAITKRGNKNLMALISFKV